MDVQAHPGTSSPGHGRCFSPPPERKRGSAAPPTPAKRGAARRLALASDAPLAATGPSGGIPSPVTTEVHFESERLWAGPFCDPPSLSDPD